MSQGAALALTWAIELFVAITMTGRRDVRFVVVVVVASLVTHPLAWSVGARATPETWWARVLLVEAAVAVVEGVFVRVAAREGAGVVVGVAMNFASFGVGLVIVPALQALSSRGVGR
jgi:hypothetical protein